MVLSLCIKYMTANHFYASMTFIVYEVFLSLSLCKMLRSLGLFLSDQEKKLSRLACPPPSSMDGDDNMDFFNYEPNLFLQGFVVVSGGEEGEEGGSEGTQTERSESYANHTQLSMY